MAALRIVLTVILILVSIVFTAIVLMQEGKSAGLGAISGAAETYWGKPHAEYEDPTSRYSKE